MIPERDYLMVKHEVERRQREAAEERAAREARRAAVALRSEQARSDEKPRGAFGWLRRLAGARH